MRLYSGFDIKVTVLPAPGQVILNFYLPQYKIYLPNINNNIHRATNLKVKSKQILKFRCPSGRYMSTFTCPNTRSTCPGQTGNA